LFGIHESCESEYVQCLTVSGSNFHPSQHNANVTAKAKAHSQ